jgi:hypothetical protein
LIDWYSYGGVLQNVSAGYPFISSLLPGTFYFLPCSAGYTTDDYSKPCLPCPLGTYKPSAGIYTCIPCANNTYADQTGMTSCINCPLYSTTNGISANSTYSCVCLADYYTTPSFIANYANYSYWMNNATYDDRCTQCPYGSVCPVTNMTYPLAAPGFWNSPDDRFVFFECFPAEACPGGGPANCSLGYVGTNCGLCLTSATNDSQKYFKWQNKCQLCTSGAWWRAILFILFLGIVTLAFFGFASIKVSHLSSISIAFSFWQVISIFNNFDIIWPANIQNTFTLASIFNFNLDFLSPQCIITTMNWQTKWALETVLPFLFLLTFILLYVCGEIRSFLANHFGKHIPIKYMAFYESEYDELKNEGQIPEDFAAPFTTYKQKAILFLKEFILIGKNVLVWLRNFCVWFIKQGLTRYQMQTFRNKCINSYTAFISFTYIFIITQASTIFVCTRQPNGSYTLNESPNIFCFGNSSNGYWNAMLPATIIIYVVFGLGAVIFFMYVFIHKKRLKRMENEIKYRYARIEELKEEVKLRKGIVGDIEIADLDQLMENDWMSTEFVNIQRFEARVKNSDKNFRERYKFLLSRFKRRYFYWEAVITSRKLIISLLYTFLYPVQVVVFGILTIFVALLLHVSFVPFRQKFHNLMEYIVLLSTLLVLFLGFLFFVQDWPAPWVSKFAEVITVTITVLCSTIVVFMILYDMWTRRRKDQKKQYILRKQLEESLGKTAEVDLKKQYKNLFPNALKNMNRIVIDAEDDPNDPWIIEENLLNSENDKKHDQWSIEYSDDEMNPWHVAENMLLEDAKKQEEDDWIVTANLLAQDDKGEAVYANMSTRRVRIEFDLPFYMSDKDDSEEETSRNINDVIDSLFTIQRLKNRITSIKNTLVKVFAKRTVEEVEENPSRMFLLAPTDVITIGDKLQYDVVDEDL